MALLAAALLISSGIWVYNTVRDQVANWSVTDSDFVPKEGEEVTNGQNAGNNSNGIPNPNQFEIAPFISTDSLQSWQGKERISILLLGIDQRCDETGPTRTDSMMILTVDPIGLSASALSLPRDLWVEIPGYRVDRINQAHYLGELNEHPGGGAGLAMETVESLLGVEVDYYAAINFDGFVQFINHIDGIRVDVPEAIDDPIYPDSCYGHDPFEIDAGEQNMNGQIALKYARTRATSGGDIDRAKRQQLVLLAIRDKIMQFDMVPKLMLESPQLWQTFQNAVGSNMSLDEALQLALLMKDIPRDSISTAVINYEMAQPYTTPDGQQVLVPVRENIRGLRDQLFRPPAIPTPMIENLPALVEGEAAKVKIINGTQTFGLAANTQAYLQSYDIDVVEIGNADASTYRTTQIIDYSDKNYTSQYLTQLMFLPPLNISSGVTPDGDYDILIILGSDWQDPSDDAN